MSALSGDLGSAEAVRLIEDATVTHSDEPAFMARIRLRARRRVLWLRQLWAADSGGNMGLAISHGEVDRILLGAGELARAELFFHHNDPEARELAGPIEAADAATADDELVGRCRREFGLGDAEVDLLTLTVAIEGDPWLGRAFGYLHDDANSCLATPWLAQQLFQWPAAAEVGPDAALVRWRMARPADGQVSPWSVSASWLADPHVASCLLRGLSLDPRLTAAIELLPAQLSVGDRCLYPAELAAMTSFVDALWRGGTANVEISLLSPSGGGKRTLAAQLAADLGVPLLIADAGRLMGPAVDLSAATEAMIQVTRTARLFGACVYWHDADRADPGAWHDAARRAGFTIFGGGSAPTAAVDEHGAARRTFRLPALTRAARAELWTRMSALAVPPPVLEWSLLPGDIARAAAVAPAGPDAVAESCGAIAPVESSELAVRLPQPYEWDDLVVPAPVRRHLQEFEAQARLRWPVYEEWDLGRLCPTGHGITALFAGPSGTGKTMSAQIVARSLGMEIYRIDLAAVVDKYIGETEKNLGRVFDAAEHANVLLFFDEADALFGQRTQVKDAHDRFANIQVDYLLQRMERFEGIAVLATNRRGDLDSAFVRRLRFIVDFMPPGVAERRALWTLALPSYAPNGEDLLGPIDWDALAQRLELTGADIKAAALAAAFLARDQGTRIEMSHVVHAVRRELAKRGMVMRAEHLGG